ncbi:MAG: MFS transporter [Phormidesmis sp.]
MEPYEGLFQAASSYLPQALPSWLAHSLLAQVGGELDPEALFSGPQFFVSLISGVILAFGFQLLLTNLAVATGVSYMAHSSNSSSSDSDSSGSGVKKIGFLFGICTLLAVSFALFCACSLAVRLSLYDDPWLGGITGLVIWATYFTLLVWFSSTTVGSLIGSVVKSATSGFQTLMGTATAALGAKGASDQVVQTAEAAAAAVRREFTTGVDVGGIQDSLQSYIASLRSPEVDVESVEKEFERLIRKSDLTTTDRDALPQIDKATFEELLGDRTDLSREENKRLAERLYRVWQKNTGSSQNLAELMTFVASATGGQLASEGIGSQLNKLIYELRQHRSKDGSQDGSSQDGSQDGGSGPGPVQQVAAQSLNTMISMVMGKADLSDLDAKSIIKQIKSAQGEIAGKVSSSAPQALKDAAPSDDDNIVKADVEDYLHHAYVSELKSARLEETFRNVLYDNEANETDLREQLSGFSRKLFVDILALRGLLTQSEIKDISDRLEITRQTVLRDVTEAEAVSAEKRIQAQIESFFKYSPASELSSDMGERAFRAIIEDAPLQAPVLRDRLMTFSADYFRQFLLTRDDVAAHETAERYEQLLKRILADADGLNQAAKVRLQQQQQSLENYLRNTGKSELSPEGIKRDVKALLDEPDQGVRQIRGRLASFDRDTLVSLLSQRQEFSEQDIDQVISSVEDSWASTVHAPQKIGYQAQAKYNEATDAIAEYLRSTGKPELSPEGIQRDLEKLLNHPKAGAQAIRYRLSKMDRDTLVQLLAQRDDLEESDINQTIDNLISGIEQVVKSPRRMARRTRNEAVVKAASFQSALENYLRNTDKQSLDPDGIKRDLKLLLNDPKLGASKLSDRIAQMDDSTVVALLAQREDMTEEEAQATVARVADVRNQVVGQLRSIQRSVESALDRIFASIRDYLQSLERPELDYYGIKRDVNTMLDDPKSGFEAMRLRLSHFDRDTLVAIATSHDSISERDAYRVIDQVEAAKNNVLKKAESLERQVESRLIAVKEQTQKQIEDTKAAAEAAAWWLFLTAAVSAGAAVIGGIIAT